MTDRLRERSRERQTAGDPLDLLADAIRRSENGTSFSSTANGNGNGHANGNGNGQANGNGNGRAAGSPPSNGNGRATRSTVATVAPAPARRGLGLPDRTLAYIAIVVGVVALVAASISGMRHAPAATQALPLLTAGPNGAAAAKGPAPLGSVAERASILAKLNAPYKTQTEDGITYESFKEASPFLPPVSGDKVKNYRIDTYMHETKVSADLPPMQVWSFAVNGVMNRGNGSSAPIVVNQGDTVNVEFHNGSSKAMNVDMGHSLDFHAAEVAASSAFRTIGPGETLRMHFVARTPGVYLYHCATPPVEMHLGAGMAGMFVVKPKNLDKVDKELFLVQQEYYMGKPGEMANMDKINAQKPDVIAWNGYADQYMDHPIRIKKGEKIRIWVENAGVTRPWYFHVIGAVFDKTWSEGVTGGNAQVLPLAPSQAGYVEFSVKQEGAYWLVNHNFADMEKGGMGALLTEHAPKDAMDGF